MDRSLLFVAPLVGMIVAFALPELGDGTAMGFGTVKRVTVKSDLIDILARGL